VAAQGGVDRCEAGDDPGLRVEHDEAEAIPVVETAQEVHDRLFGVGQPVLRRHRSAVVEHHDHIRRPAREIRARRGLDR
jgi:hypothetical protein